MPLRWWLWFVLEHEIHHKAQLALYLREMGKVPPFFALPLPDLVRTFRSVSSWAGYERAADTQRTRSRGGARRPATTPPPVGAGRRAAGTSIERHHGNTSGFCAFCRLCFRAAARSMPRATRPPAGDASHFSPRDSAPQRPLREIVSALSAIFASDDKVIYVSLLTRIIREGDRKSVV